jgi:hypothetical protein
MSHRRLGTLDHKRIHAIGFNGKYNQLGGFVREQEVKTHGRFVVVPLHLDLNAIQTEMQNLTPTLRCVLTGRAWRKLREGLKETNGNLVALAEIGLTNVKLVAPEDPEKLAL